jgi:anti-sigma factor RsiW
LDCRDTQNLLDGYGDGELDLVRTLAIERHLQDCPVCTQIQQNNQTLQSALKETSLYFKAPTNLHKRLRGASREAIQEVPRYRVSSWRGASVAAASACVALLMWVLISLPSRPAAEDLLAQEVVSGHIRSLMANHLTDVPSSDHHTVKPWFDGKLDFAPPVTDLTKQGFPLVGGRLDYIGSKSVAAVVYQRRQHFLNLFIWPSNDSAESGNKMMTRQGYNVIRWNQSGMTFWLVSDLNLSELQQFAEVVQNPN